MGQFNTIEEALEDLRNGKIILATDDPERENEGDFICGAEFATTDNINFMATYGKGLICMPMSEEYIKKLRIPQMVPQNTDNHETAFTVSIDHVSTSTGISAAERSVTAMRCVKEDARPGAGAQWAHGSYCGSVPAGWFEGVRPVLRDHEGGRNHDAHPGADGAGETMEY